MVQVLADLGIANPSVREKNVERIQRFLTSPIGRKVMMGLTGLLLILFLVGHLVGNLLLFKGSADFNNYSRTLLSTWLIYPVEIGLLVMFLYHAVSGVAVWWTARTTNPTPYDIKVSRMSPASRKGFSSSTMIYTGVIVLLFLAVHLITLKWGGDGGKFRDLAGDVKSMFKNPVWVGVYVVCMAVLGLHLFHGFGSAFESLGFRHRNWLRRTTQAVTVVLSGAFLLIPVLVMAFF
ncbi:MAG: hypothetical protein AUK47_08520 [Deltaproteobacteria bacterium CG2_30_63_29]|nr:MAG: hypothetical protein AUK47_08520 [Deltaproteobacteria bacterium CG2_30_63_29]PIV98404.1 MAG: hypothetical protein COW42_14860 [Deltaproteobacteria bacterium CG17_big_fil_post_rev_8_21_14_2_50_63_7]PJB39086.1 MAG: hypothetical protein CO108_17865 [Deltaproteobacteria bacterium CG_4_9_14_3_um_filter_63_12]